MNPARRDPRALILIGVGVVWLIAQSGFVPGAAASGLGFYWPLLIIGLGVDLLGWKRPWRVPYTAIAAALVLLGVALFPTPNAVGVPTRFSEPVGAATAATVDLALGDAVTNVTSVADSASLLTADTQGWRHAVFDVAHTNPKRIRVSPEAGGRAPVLTFRPNRWRIGLDTAVPLTLAVDMGSGRADLDLRDVTLSALTVEGGSGDLKAVLPAAAARYRVGIHGGSGASDVRIAPGAAVDLVLNAGSGRTGVTFGEFGSARVTVRSGSGPVVIDVPSEAAVRLLVTSDGSGPLRLGRFLKRQAGSGETGLWASGPAAAATPSIDITVERAGSGPITVR